LESALRDLLAQRRREALERGWADIPESVFCSVTGGPLDERNVVRTWHRVRRKAQKPGVRPLRLHDARHTFASLAIASGKSVRWVASQLGHANPELTLRVYAHALQEEETDLSFLDFGGTRRHPRGT
jgi:integrase